MKALVFGYFSAHNIGDSLFKEAYHHLFPDYSFIFTDKITEELFNSSDVLFFGGGSFLDGEPNIPNDLLKKLPEKPIIYLGIGAETEIHPWHKFLIKKSKLVIVRSQKSFDKVKELNVNSFLYPDLVYSLSEENYVSDNRKGILYIPNAHTIAKYNDPSWKENAWNYFKSEFSQALEILEKDYTIDILAMCSNSKHRDENSGAEILNKMTKTKINIIPFVEHDFKSITTLMNKYKLIISQRYHGLVLADILGIKNVNIYHHSKLQNFNSINSIGINYYELSKNKILDSIDFSDGKVSINKHLFKGLVAKINQTLKD